MLCNSLNKRAKLNKKPLEEMKESMYAQMFLGVWFLINAGFNFFGIKIFLKKSVISALSTNELTSYQRGFVLPYILLGILFIVMGIIESKGLLSTLAFIGVYIILVSIPFALLFKNNKKHSGSLALH